MPDVLRAAHSTASETSAVVEELVAGLAGPASTLVLFFSPKHDGLAIAQGLRERFPGAEIVGCGTAGEFSTGKMTTGGVSVAALGSDLVVRRASALVSADGGLNAGTVAAVKQLELQLGQSLRSLDPERYVGLVFIDSTHGIEEALHIELGDVAPFLSFVGGSAGDDIAFKDTPVLANDAMTSHGAALMVLELDRPFRVVKSCHFEPTETSFEVTKADGRLLIELDGRPAAEVYAEHLGLEVAALTLDNLFMHPVGLVIDGEAWIRQVNPPYHKDGAIYLGCEVVAGSTLHFLRPSGSIVAHLRRDLDGLRAGLGEIQGALVFDCALRRFEIEATQVRDAYCELFDFPAAGFYTHGESWLGHMHQTMTALVFGER